MAVPTANRFLEIIISKIARDDDDDGDSNNNDDNDDDDDDNDIRR